MDPNHELRMRELEQATNRRYWQVGAVLWATCIIGLTIQSLVR